MNHQRLRRGGLAAAAVAMALTSACKPATPARMRPRHTYTATAPGAPEPARVTALSDLSPEWVRRTQLANLFDGRRMLVLRFNEGQSYAPRTRTNSTPFVVVLGNRSGSQGVDTDRDGLSDAAEIAIGTNPNNADTDGDTIPDGFEIVGLRTLATSADSNGNGVPDNVELNLDDPSIYNDDDGDGFSNAQEIARFGTNPRSLDSDGDGIDDDLEYYYGTALNDRANPSRDSDNDGWPDEFEMANNSDPSGDSSHDPDADNDGVPDWLDEDGLSMAAARGRPAAAVAAQPICTLNCGSGGPA
ncbi:MAG: hypothetical protein Q8Q09_13070 [Deltaproteobacteria bacterium]|nr:hypothetical protein [Deltaproteobacteria bacterium]